MPLTEYTSKLYSTKFPTVIKSVGYDPTHTIQAVHTCEMAQLNPQSGIILTYYYWEHYNYFNKDRWIQIAHMPE